MERKHDLTVLLTLKGRDRHTLRWLKYANDNRFPFHIFIADGQPCLDTKHYLEDSENIKNLSIEYHEYNDIDRVAFYKKTLDALNRIRSKYVMFCGNNDFLFVPGLEKCIKFLEQHQDYICAGGGTSCIILHPAFLHPKANEHLYGEITGFRYQDNSYRSKSFEEGTILERMVSLISNYSLVFYHVYRTDGLRKIAEDVVQLEIGSPNIHEYFMALRTITLGRVKSFPEYPTYIRGFGTSMSRGHTENSSNIREHLHYLLHGTYSEDMKKCIGHLGKILHEAKEIETDKDLDVLREAFTYRLYLTLRGTGAIPAEAEMGKDLDARPDVFSHRLYLMLRGTEMMLPGRSTRQYIVDWVYYRMRRLLVPKPDPKAELLVALRNLGSDEHSLVKLDAELRKIQILLTGLNSPVFVDSSPLGGDCVRKFL